MPKEQHSHSRSHRRVPMADIVHIIDDDEAIRESTAYLLSLYDFAPLSWKSGDEFLEKADLDARACALLDLRMPGRDGLATHQEMSRRGSRMPVIIVTGHGDTKAEKLAHQSGAAAFLEKPYDVSELVETIRTALRTAN